MKNYILAIATAIIALFSSCSSDNPITDSTIENPDSKLYTATFSVNGITSETGAFSTRSTSLTDMNIKYLEYWVFQTADISWTMEKDPVLRDTVADYNKAIALTLPKGDYTILLFATDSDEKITSTSKSDVDFVDGKYQMYSGKKQFVIDDQNTVIDEKIDLNRMVGKLEFVIEDLDKLPADVQSISIVGDTYTRISGRQLLLAKMCMINLATGYAGTKIGSPLLPTIPRSDFSKYNKDNPISVYAHPSGTYRHSDYEFMYVNNIYIQGSKDNKFYDYGLNYGNAGASGNVIFMRNVGKYAVEANKVTRFTGKIGSLDNVDHNITFGDWSTVTVEAD